MAISTVNYPTPVMVNGYPCKNCTEVDEAKAHIDPQHPAAGPYGVNAKADPTLSGKPSVSFGGALSGLDQNSSDSSAGTSAPPPSPRLGSQLNISA